MTNSQKIALMTLGCPKNQVDSEVLAGVLRRGGMVLKGNIEEADIILVNTCCFIEEARKESVEAILKAVELKENRREIKVCVWGCLSERYKGEIERDIPEVDKYFGVEPYEEMGRFLIGDTCQWNEKAFGQRVLSTPSHVAYLKIADGCDHGCTFCAIPLFKGPYRSRPIDSLVDESWCLAKRGVKELILIAQDTTAYGSDFHGSINLVTLLKRLVGIDSIQWIRIMYGHPAHVTDELIDFIAQEKKICRYLDLPLQHISDNILKRMSRGTRRESIENLVKTLRSRISGLVLRTSFIVGFPGETEEMFKELLDFVRETHFERIGVFVFSPEQGTKAFRMKPAVPKGIAEDRYRVLMEVQQSISQKINRSLESRILSVMVDGYDGDQKLFYGRSEGDGLDVDQTVWIAGKAPVGEIVPVKIEASSAYDIMGRIYCDE